MYMYVCIFIYLFIYMCVYIHVYIGLTRSARADPLRMNTPTISFFTDGSYTKGTRAHTHRELIREWLGEPKGSSLEYIGLTPGADSLWVGGWVGG